MLKKVVISLWSIVFGLLFFYSFAQVDLGLTLTRASVFLTIEKSFQYIGYFNRPLSAWLSSGIFILLFLLYVWTLRLVWKKKIGVRTIWVITFCASLILLFSYNAFSYDLFNYIFDAKIFTHYHSNPYLHKALDYPQDPMLGFMHWTHRTFPYGPVWIGLTIPLSYIGFGYFIITFYLFKALMVGSYLLSCYFIFKTAKKMKLADPVFALAFFALNPLVIIESLVSAHNDIAMMALTLAAVYFLIERKIFSSGFFLILSIGIKFATVILAPTFLYILFFTKVKKVKVLSENVLTNFFLGAILLMLIAVYLATVRTTFQPWYFLLVLPFAAFISHKYYISIPSALFSFLILFQYIPYFYTGNYNPPIPFIMNEMLWSAIGVSVGITILTAGIRLIKR